jgi:hypothetical protein
MNLNGISSNPCRAGPAYYEAAGPTGWTTAAMEAGRSAAADHDRNPTTRSRATPSGRIIVSIEKDVRRLRALKAAGATVVAEPGFEQAPGTWIATFSDGGASPAKVNDDS